MSGLTPTDVALIEQGATLALQLGSLLASNHVPTAEERAAIRSQVEAHYQAVQAHRAELGLPPLEAPTPWPVTGAQATTTPAEPKPAV